MRKIILSVAVSLDGYIEGPKGEYDWCPPPSKKEMGDFLQGIDTIFMGRKSYEMAGKSMFRDKEHYVFSDTLNDKTKGVYIIRSNMLKTVGLLQQEKGKNIWLFGGASLISTFINQTWSMKCCLRLFRLLSEGANHCLRISQSEKNINSLNRM